MITFYLEFNGNTFLSQVKDNSLEEAILDWLKNYDYQSVKEFKDISRQDFIKCWDTEEPSKIQGLEGVYCLTARIKDYFIILHVSGVPPLLAQQKK
jgi:hypothetical protein